MIDEVGIIMDIVLEYGWIVPGRHGGGVGSGVMNLYNGTMFFAYKNGEDMDNKLFISIRGGILMVRNNYEEPRSNVFRMALGDPECIDKFRGMLERYSD